jgi:CHAT domain-containing protein
VPSTAPREKESKARSRYKESRELHDAERHLTSEEIDGFLAPQAATEGVSEKGVLREELRRHLENCAICQTRLRFQGEVEESIRRLRHEAVGEPRPDCPPEEQILGLAAKMITGRKAEGLLEHAAGCDHCGPLLREVAYDFETSLTEEEKAVLSQLKTGKADWPRAFARTLASAKPEAAGEARRTLRYLASRGSKGIPRWVFAAVAVVVLAAGFALWRIPVGGDEHHTQELLDQAFSEQRTLELRMGNAPHGPMRIERGAGRSRAERPAALLEAELLIAKNLPNHASEVPWIEAKARADLLEGDYSGAMDSLEGALGIEPNAPDLEIDLASAYFLRGETESKANDYGTAIELLGKVLEKQPNNHVALFNRAIVAERLSLYAQAREDWKRYLTLEPGGEWAEEARQRLNGLEKREKEHGPESGEPLLRPEQLNEQVHLDERATWGVVDERIEEYLGIAVREWLSDAFREDGDISRDTERARTRDALHLLATISAEQHQDRWLSDLLRSSSDRHFATAVHALGNAASASDRADYESALRESATAERWFSRMGNQAGEARARFERVFGLQFSIDVPKCAREAQVTAPAAKKLAYEWLYLQSEIEEGICENASGNFDSAQTVLHFAIVGSKFAAYRVTYMRAITMAALVEWSKGNGVSAWNGVRKGVADCWADHCPHMSVYSFYANMDNFAEDRKQWHLQVAVAKQAVLTLASDPDCLMRAVEHSRLAKAAVLAGLPGLAEEHLEKARALLSSAPETETTQNYRAGIEIDVAKLSGELGDSASGLEHLRRVRPQLAHFADPYLLMNFEETLGQLEMSVGHFADAETALREAISIAEQELGSIPTMRDRIAWQKVNGVPYRTLVELELRQERPEAALEIWEWYLAAPQRIKTDNRKRTLGPWRDLRSAAAFRPRFDRQTVVSYAVLGNRVAAWVFSDREEYFTWIAGSSDDLVSLVAQFKRSCANRVSLPSATTALARRVYDGLMAPVAAHVSVERALVFEGDDELADLPMAAAVDPEGKYLVDRYTIVESTGSAAYRPAQTRGEIRATERAVVVAAATTGNRSLEPIADVRREAEDVARVFPNSRVFEGDDTDLQEIEREMSGAVVFHYAGHASLGAWGRALSLNASRGSEGQLDASGVRRRLTRRMRLAVFSACSTEKGANSGVSDPGSLARAFLEAGVPQVVASRWEVDSATAVELMNWFYGGLLEGKSVAESLREAETRVRSSPGGERPYYWAAFGAFGNE